MSASAAVRIIALSVPSCLLLIAVRGVVMGVFLSDDRPSKRKGGELATRGKLPPFHMHDGNHSAGNMAAFACG